jgi:K+-transporting ATPase ATPase C chain
MIMLKQIKTATFLFLVFTILTGFIYPMLITGIGQVVFPGQANGSLLVHGDKIVGSKLIGQQFDQPQYFWGRLSATSGSAYNAAQSSGSNLSALNPNLEKQLKARIQALQAADPENTLPIPVDLVTASASGLDPHISVASATYQASRIARVRGLPMNQVTDLIETHTENPVFGFLGEKVVNVLELNIALDGIQ